MSTPRSSIRGTLVAAVMLVAACRADRTGSVDSPHESAGSTQTASSEWFTDRAHASGLDFVHFNGMSGELYVPEILAPGVAVLDYDNDGDLDVFLVQGQMLGVGKMLRDALFPPRVALPLRDRLYRNDLDVGIDGVRALHFTDVTESSGIDARSYGMGVATGDVDNDGCIDILRTGFGRVHMFHNNCDGTFADVTSKIGLVDDGAWSVSAAFVDIDRDGWLDLYVGNYLRYALERSTPCFSASGALDYCMPRSYQALPDRLYRNRGNGTFSDITAASRIATAFGPALGVATADFNGDGWLDLYVANDGKENQLWLNQRNMTLLNAALLAGVALPLDGKAEASMGVDAGDFDNDGDEDLFVTELTGEGANLFVNDGSGTFEDRSVPSGLGPATVRYTGFGTGWVDIDNDGRLDLFTVNGHVQTIQELAQKPDPFPLHQRKQLFRNVGEGRFEEVTGQAGAAFALSEVSRGVAMGDVDNDGDIDLLIGNNNGPTRLLINEVGARKHWLGLRLVGDGKVKEPVNPPAPGSGLRATEKQFREKPSRSPKPVARSPGRDMLGARVEVRRSNGSTLWRRVRTDGSYASASDPRVLVGLGDSNAPVTVRVHWPSGRVEQWEDVRVGRYVTLTEGTAK